MTDMTKTRSALIKNPNLAYSIALPEPIRFTLTPYWRESFSAIMGNLTGLSISEVQPSYKLGRVYSFDIYPRDDPDPKIIFCNDGDLRPYYKIWRKVAVYVAERGTRGFYSGRHESARWAIRDYDKAIRRFIETAVTLETHELCFGVIEMLKFKNDFIF